VVPTRDLLFPPPLPAAPATPPRRWLGGAIRMLAPSACASLASVHSFLLCKRSHYHPPPPPLPAPSPACPHPYLSVSDCLVSVFLVPRSSCYCPSSHSCRQRPGTLSHWPVLSGRQRTWGSTTRSRSGPRHAPHPPHRPPCAAAARSVGAGVQITPYSSFGRGLDIVAPAGAQPSSDGATFRSPAPLGGQRMSAGPAPPTPASGLAGRGRRRRPQGREGSVGAGRRSGIPTAAPQAAASAPGAREPPAPAAAAAETGKWRQGIGVHGPPRAGRPSAAGVSSNVGSDPPDISSAAPQPPLRSSHNPPLAPPQPSAPCRREAHLRRQGIMVRALSRSSAAAYSSDSPSNQPKSASLQ
jgi:hypothetical protein